MDKSREKNRASLPFVKRFLQPSGSRILRVFYGRSVELAPIAVAGSTRGRDG